MKAPIHILVTLALTVSAPALVAEEAGDAKETPPVVEAFSCTFNPDQGPAELDAAIDYWIAQVNRVNDPDLNRYGAGVATPLRATFDGDFIWIGGHANLNAMARSLDAANADPGLRQADGRFDEVATCDSNLFLSSPVYTGTPPQEASDSAIIELSACKLVSGKTLTHAEALESIFDALAKGSNATLNVFRWTPFVAATSYDVVYLSAHRDLASYAAFSTELTTSDAGREFTNNVSNVMHCDAGLYSGRLARRASN